MLVAERVSRTRKQASNLARINTYIFSAAVFLALLAQFLLFMLRIPPEAALSLQCGLLITEGKRPFIDFFEVASPALMYLHAIPAATCKLLPFQPVHPIVVFHVFVLALAIGSCIFTAELLFRQKFREQSHTPLFVLGFVTLNLLMVKEFGQREHLFLLFYVPFLVCRWLSWTNQTCGTRMKTLAGICGGISMCLDPLFMLVALLMEVFFLLSKSRYSAFRQREMLVALIVVGLFLAHFIFYPPDYANLYFNFAVPLLLADYICWDDRLFWVGKTPDLRYMVYIMVIASTFALGLRRWCSLIPPCIALAVVGFGLLVIEGKTMTYQALPMLYGSCLAGCLVLSILINFLTKSRSIRLTFLKPLVVAFASVVVVGGFLAYQLRDLDKAVVVDLGKLGYVGSTRSMEQSTFISTLERETSVQDSVLILNDRPRPAYPLLVQYNRRPCGYLLTGYPLRVSRTLIDADPSNGPKFAGYQFRMYERLIADIKSKPKIIMFEKSEEALGPMLKDHRVMEEVDKLYDELCYGDWPDSDTDPTYDYYAFRTALNVYKLKPEAKK